MSDGFGECVGGSQEALRGSSHCAEHVEASVEKLENALVEHIPWSPRAGSQILDQRALKGSSTLTST